MAKAKKFDFGNKFKEKFQKVVDGQQKDGNKYEVDERFYVPKGEGEKGDGKINVLLRFLPFEHDGGTEEDTILCFLPVKKHFIKNVKTNKTLFSECPRSFNKKGECPICELYFEDWVEINAMPEGNEKTLAKSIAKEKRAMEKYIYNVYIIDDPIEPENNGQTKLMEVGYHVHKTIMKAVDENVEKDEDEVSGFVFDLYDGYNYRYKREKEDGRNSYKSSKFINKKCAISDDDDEIEQIMDIVNGVNNLYKYKKEYEEKFLSYEKLKEKYNNLSETRLSKYKKADDVDDDEEENFEDEKETNVKNDKIKDFDDDEGNTKSKSKSKKSSTDDDLDFDDDDLFD